MNNLDWIKKGNTGCVFAAILAFQGPEKVGWKRIINPQSIDIQEDDYILSLIFPDSNKEKVLKWALDHGMYLEDTSDNTEGLRYKIGNNVAWVQYFGPDSHVKTRQSPEPELLMCVKVAKNFYHKVGFKGILHLAHASIQYINKRALDKIWEGCFKMTKRILGYSPTIKEASKTTFLKSK